MLLRPRVACDEARKYLVRFEDPNELKRKEGEAGPVRQERLVVDQTLAVGLVVRFARDEPFARPERALDAFRKMDNE